MRDTPRTDSKENETVGGKLATHSYYGWKFARSLERELAEAQDKISRLESGKTVLEHAQAQLLLAGPDAQA